jgi:tight adherence protein B
MRRLTAAIIFCVLAAGLVAQSAQAQGPARLTTVPGSGFPQQSFVLTLPSGGGLDTGHVSARENGHPVSRLSIKPAKAVGEKDFGVVLVIDATRTMRGRPIENALTAARTFARQRNPHQKLGVVTFNRKSMVTLPLTTDELAIKSALSDTPSLANNGTHVYDAVASALVLLKQEQIRAGSVVLLSDGADTGSQVSADELTNAARVAGVRIFTVGLRSRSFDPVALDRLAAAGRGDYSQADSPADLGPIYAALGSRLANEYLVQYRSLASRGSAVHVELRVPALSEPVTSDYVTPPLPSRVRISSRHTSGFWDSDATMVLVSFVCALLIGIALVALLARRPRGEALSERLEGFVSSPSGEAGKNTGSAVTKRMLQGSERSLEQTSWWPTFKEELEIAQIELPAIQLVWLTALVTVVSMVLLAAVTGSAAVALLGLAAPFVARAIVNHKLEAQRRLFADQLADNLQVIVSAMRAGHSFIGALSVAVEDSPEPARSEFRRVIADESLGVPLEQALGTVVRRMENKDLDQAVLVAMLQRQTGGNMAEVIDRVADTIRERSDLRRMVRTLTAQGRLSRWVVTGLPVGLLLIITVMNRDYVEPLYITSGGHLMLALAGVLVVMGSLVIRRIVDFKL